MRNMRWACLRPPMLAHVAAIVLLNKRLIRWGVMRFVCHNDKAMIG